VIVQRRARVGARYASLIAAPLLGTACGSPEQRASDTTIVRAAAQAQASVSAYERSGGRSRDAVPGGAACGAGLRKVAVAGQMSEGRALPGISSTAGRCSTYR
jgi:hypothetical protein